MWHFVFYLTLFFSWLVSLGLSILPVFSKNQPFALLISSDVYLLFIDFCTYFNSSFYLLHLSSQVFIASWIRSLIFNLSLVLIHGIKDKNFYIKAALATSDKLWCIIFLFSFSSNYFKISIVFSSLINGLYRPIVLSF